MNIKLESGLKILEINILRIFLSHIDNTLLIKICERFELTNNNNNNEWKKEISIIKQLIKIYNRNINLELQQRSCE